MKKLIGILFTIQLCILFFYGMFFFHVESYNRIFVDDTISIVVDFRGDVDSFHRFIGLLYEEELTVTKPIPFSESGDVLHMYATDVTLAGKVVLRHGRLPAYGTNEFIDTRDTSEENQVGIIDNILPGYEIRISHLSSPLNFNMDGGYLFHNTPLEVVEALVDRITPYVFEVNVFSWEFENSAWISLMSGIAQPFQAIEGVWEMVGLFLTISLALIFSILQYSFQYIRRSVIFKIHGFSIWCILKSVTFSLLPSLILGGFLAFALLYMYARIMRFHLFLPEVTLFFLIIALVLILVKMLITNLFIAICMQIVSQTIVLKGRKFNPPMIVITHLLKGAFSIFFIFSVFATLLSARALQTRLNARELWDDTHNVYRIHAQRPGNWNMEIEMEIVSNLKNLYTYLTMYHNGFIIDGYRMSAILEDGFEPYFDSNMAPPFELSPNAHRIDINRTFLEQNPIETINGTHILDQIILDPFVWNLVVPEALRPYEETLYALYLEEFYFQKIFVTEMYAQEMNLPVDDQVTLDDLSLNIIYVYNDQYYFTFNEFNMITTGGQLMDPVAAIFIPGNTHESKLFGLFQQSFYFRSEHDAQGAFESISPFIESNGLAEVIRFAVPVYSGFRQSLLNLTQQLIRLTILFFLIIATNLAVSYYLMVNYFEANKFELVIKRNFGFHILKRNQNLLITYLSYSIPVVFLARLLFGWEVFIVAGVFLICDISIALFFEKRLMKKSFAEIMKGEK